jgi:hypothetical protein
VLQTIPTIVVIKPTERGRSLRESIDIVAKNSQANVLHTEGLLRLQEQGKILGSFPEGRRDTECEDWAILAQNTDADQD